MKFVCETSARLDAFLASQIDDVSRSRLKTAIESGAVTVNGRKQRKGSHSLSEGDEVSVDPSLFESTAERSSIEPVDLKLNILYEDDDCFVIDKPAGISVHPGAGTSSDEPTVLHGLAWYLRSIGKDFSSDGVLVHRLDKGTTGCLLCAKSLEAHAALQKQFEERTVAKFYLAITAGVPDPKAAVIDAPVGRNLTDRTKMSVLRTSVSREARTTYVTLDATNDVSLLECELHTGRTHQIRVHLSSVGHPLLGDETYGTPQSKKLTEHYGVRNIALHAWKLTFDSPFTDKEVYVKAPVPQTFDDALRETDLKAPE